MRFAIEPSAQVQPQVRRVARSRIDRALTELDGLETKSPTEIEDGVHDVRKRCKEVRALARLVRESLGADGSNFNDMVRDAANELSSIRDAHAVQATLQDLLDAWDHDYDNDADVATVRLALADAAAEATMTLGDNDPRIGKASELLVAARRRVRRWEIDEGSAWLGAGISSSYKRGRRGLRQARRRPDDDRMHEWRKSVKTLWYQVRLIEGAAPSVLTPLVSQLDHLADALGDDHDLSVLVARLEADPGSFGGKKPVKKVARIARDQQRDLRRRAFRLGESVYAETTRAFVARLDCYWQTTLDQGPELATGKIADLIAVEAMDDS